MNQPEANTQQTAAAKTIATAIAAACADAFSTDCARYSSQDGVANVAETLDALAGNVERLGYAITADAARGSDATGGSVTSLTEAVMGVTAGLVRIANAMESIAEAIDGLAAKRQD